MKVVRQKIEESFIKSCSVAHIFTGEEFVQDHKLVYQVSGQTLIDQQGSTLELQEGQLLLIRKNQVTKCTKAPAADGEYHAVALVLSSERLRQYALTTSIISNHRYNGPKYILLPSHDFIKSYFQSLLPYIEHSEEVSTKLASMKVNEAMGLLLELYPELRTFLFDFDDPSKSGLEEFMLKNFHYNVPLENLAKLSGRSLTSFKREFAANFKTTPSKWLKDKRLSEAYYLLTQHDKRPQDIYIELGFQNLSHFYTCFKQKYGHTPAGAKLKDK